LLQAVDGLSAEQRIFQPAEDRWSVVGCVEHIILVERLVFNNIQTALQAPPEPAARQTEVRLKDPIVIERVPARTRRVIGPEVVHPKNRWPEFDQLLGQFNLTRDDTVDFATHTSADLRCHFFPHPFIGDMDCYQWLLFVGLHCERHVRQLEEVKADHGFPQ